MVKAKFRCKKVISEESYYNGKNIIGGTVVLEPVYGDGEANKSWAEATPSGKLEMLINNPEALKEFVPGKDYFLNIEICSN